MKHETMSRYPANELQKNTDKDLNLMKQKYVGKRLKMIYEGNTDGMECKVVDILDGSVYGVHSLHFLLLIESSIEHFLEVRPLDSAFFIGDDL